MYGIWEKAHKTILHPISVILKKGFFKKAAYIGMLLLKD